jgi:hypothetical protein
MQYVSLLTPGFSGSTLVSMLLCSQNGTVGFGDTYFSHVPRHVPKHPCTCGKWYDQCAPRADIATTITAAGTPDFAWNQLASVPIPNAFRSPLRRFWPLARSTSLPLVRAIPDAARRRLFKRYYRENELMLDGLEQSGKYDVYFDGCKDLVRLELLRSIFPEIKVLHVVRHPGAYLYHFHKLGEAMYAKRLKHWARYHRHARRFSNFITADNYLAVTYEHIVQEPAMFAGEFGEFAGKPQADTTDADRIRREDIHVMGNRMRETTERVLDYSNTWRGKMPAIAEKMADDVVRQDPWYSSLFNNR